MRRYRRALRTALSTEAKAYGFTLVFWGTGALAEAERGLPGRAGTMAFIGGALGAMALVILASFGGPSSTWQSGSLRRYAFGAVHIGSVAAGLAVGWGVAAAISDKTLAYLVAGASSVLTYQLVLGAEIVASVATPEDAEHDAEHDAMRARVGPR